MGCVTFVLYRYTRVVNTVLKSVETTEHVFSKSLISFSLDESASLLCHKVSLQLIALCFVIIIHYQSSSFAHLLSLGFVEL